MLTTLDRSRPVSLEYSPAIAAETALALRARVRVMPEMEWPVHAPYIAEINRLKREKNAVILAHNYQTPEIFNCVADIVGDSLSWRAKARKTKADIIVMAGVHFMAETAKMLSPEKTVLIPDVGPAVRWPNRSPPPMSACCANAIPACRSSPMSIPRPT